MFYFDPLPRYGLDFVSIDCPWKWVSRTSQGEKKSANAKYKTMSLAQIAALPVAELLAPEGVLGMWCTWPLIGQQHLIAENAWGLKVVTGGAWAKRTVTGKLRPGTGFIFRSVCEPFLICTLKGHKLRARGRAYNLIETFDQLGLDGIAREHSRKPQEWFDLIGGLTPGWRRADVFSRESRRGWLAWGDEIAKFDKAA
jgi:N6-adenosine-specific RNA methylase IME4